jgi:hypothetical protein
LGVEGSAFSNTRITIMNSGVHYIRLVDMIRHSLRQSISFTYIHAHEEESRKSFEKSFIEKEIQNLSFGLKKIKNA